MSYDFKITLKKVGIQALIVLVAGLAATYGNNPFWLAIAPVANGIVNYLKHKDD